ncbi:hypothetical protein [Leptospira sp. GIMC2001]|uniref:hypothetical protein n=1 Tax=Leptospira sp. GIMC2001 TaxID=1513297 RepID=UPI00234A8252|nr:hypothetical protein [Leptospira sp. GIMC2001]WCL50985.1 hypothetical protein O4O04_09290 [Leptospira sp. GIMC2001]
MNKEIVMLLCATLIQLNCATERKVCFEKFGVSSDDGSRNISCIMAYGIGEDAKNENLPEFVRRNAELNYEAALSLCYYGFIVEAECGKESNIMLNPEFRNPLW